MDEVLKNQIALFRYGIIAPLVTKGETSPQERGDFFRDAVGDVLEELVGYALDGRLDGVAGVDGADDDRPLEGALPVADAGGLEIRHDRKILPHLAGEAICRELFAEDGVGFADGRKPLTGDRAGAADTEPRARERLTVDHVRGKTERASDHADLVLVEELDRLDKLEIELFGKAADVVVRLDAFSLSRMSG